jgi:hypothetical protein
MKTPAHSNRKKKIIELYPETEKQLRIMAVSEGYNLKSYIEHILEDMVNEDEELIRLSQVPGTEEIISEKEMEDFINSLPE